MDPLTVATTIGIIFLTKALEKSGEKFGEATIAKVGQAIAKIREHSPETAKALEAGNPTVLNLGKAVLEEIPPDPIFTELVAAADAEENQEFKEKFQAVKAGGTITIIGKQINVSQAGTNNTQNNTFTL
ncbi:hypothetical protein TUMEXPCC7403_10595 [Tumidithrix helvetica PCC 7403]|uniref:hypothetical protein n=1 Tax=Tumidithrix helvetica TaxID=3457545 RepID=UPI003C9DF12B